ncbi:GNAT family N-acetyltransferase [Rubrivirga sp.]|uniref:GNAT family N-acetyltransferase n=1 Tax=Rubrivirga sp. TaxID=1885344 RepID=UPI003C711180
MPDVRHETDKHRFVADVEGGMAELEYTLDGDVASFVHTLVPKPARGQDIGTALVEAGLSWARNEGMRIVPACPFVAAYVKKNPKAQDLVA